MVTVDDDFIVGLAKAKVGEVMDRMDRERNTDPHDPAKMAPAPYDAANSGGSNLAPTSKALAERLSTDRHALDTAQPELAGKALPSDMLTTSASGLDPDISPEDAALQAPRVARARSVAVEQISRLVQQHIDPRSLRIFGEPRVNVLQLNLALRQTYPGR